MFHLRILLLAFLAVIIIKATIIKHSFRSDEFDKHLTVSDLSVYLKSLKRVVYFCSTNKNDLDMNFIFGLFLVNVNLKVAIKERHLPKLINDYVKLILQENDELLDFFDTMVHRDGDYRDRLNKMIVSLFSNETMWMKRLQRFKTAKNYFDLGGKLNYKRGDLADYVSLVDKLDNWVPSPSLSDTCMISLANNRDHDSDDTVRCSLFELCYDMLNNGTDFGYALSHRLLLLINAKHGRGCAVFSPYRDKKLRRKLCNISLNETKYIADNDYIIIDLILEMIALCGLDGHAQFLRRDWLAQILKFQSSYGCFGMAVKNTRLKSSITRPSKTWRLAKHRDHQILGGMCNGHVSSVAAAALSVAIRYIIETNF